MPHGSEKEVPRQVLCRLPRYYRCLKELLKDGVGRICSQEMAERLGVTASQIRQDLNYFGLFGQQSYGYKVETLVPRIAEILGVNDRRKAVVIGAGHLGYALANGEMFWNCGIELVGVFDRDSAVVGQTVGGLTVRDVKELDAFLQRETVDIGVLTLPAASVWEVEEALRRRQIPGIWNFSGAELASDGQTLAVNMSLGDSLMMLTYAMRKRDGTSRRKGNRKESENT